MLRFDHLQSDPSSRKHSAKLAMGKQRDVAGQVAQASQQPVGAPGYVRGRLTMGTTVAPDTFQPGVSC